MTPKITFITALIRPQNLLALERSAISVIGEKLPWNWLVVADEKFVTDRSTIPSVNAHLVYSNISQRSFGFLEKNLALDLIQEDNWIYFLDDDTELHPNFLPLFSQGLKETPQAQGMVFGQLLPDGTVRDTAVPGLEHYLGKIDMCQFVLKRSAIGELRFLPGFGADGIFFTQVYNCNRPNFYFTTEVGVHHNNLRAGEPWTPERGYGPAYQNQT